MLEGNIGYAAEKTVCKSDKRRRRYRKPKLPTQSRFSASVRTKPSSRPETEDLHRELEDEVNRPDLENNSKITAQKADLESG